MTEESNFQRATFKSGMVMMRHIADTADLDLVRFMHDQLTETVKFLNRRMQNKGIVSRETSVIVSE